MGQDPTGAVEHPMLAGARAVSSHLAQLGEANAWSLSDDEIGLALEEITAAEARLAAVKLAVIAEADGRGIGSSEATSTAGWLRGRLLLHPGEANRAVQLAAALRENCPATGTALSAGRVSAAHAGVITQTMADLPPVDPTVRASAEEFLIEQATVLDPLLLGRAGQALRETLTTQPDSDQRAQRQHNRRELTLIPAYDGMVALRGMLQAESAALLTAALHPLAAPRPADGQTPDPRNAAQRRADALLDLARIALASGTLPETGGTKPTLVVTIGLDQLQGRLAGAGTLPDGAALSAAAARRLACDATIIPAILGGPSQPLDIGRATRTVPAPMRAALITRDQACAFPSCGRPAAWTEAHHIQHWTNQGITALKNLVLLCPEHHTAVHHSGWTVTIETDGLPTFTAPPWTDPTQTPRRHHRYQLRQLQHDLPGRDPPHFTSG